MDYEDGHELRALPRTSDMAPQSEASDQQF